MSVDPLDPAAVDQRAFRDAASRFPTGVSVVATTHNGVDHAMTVSAFTSVSLDPVLVLICVEKNARFHQAVLGSGSWAVSVLPGDAEEVSRWFAEKGRPTERQLADYPYHRGPATSMPVLDVATAVLECRTRAVYDGGDHDILLGDVVGLWVDAAPRSPLVYFEGSYRQLR
jgi:flavin reductase (DIM6/NTAB) family NADH-FMN oxidoreductase RutF